MSNAEERKKNMRCKGMGYIKKGPITNEMKIQKEVASGAGGRKGPVRCCEVLGGVRRNKRLRKKEPNRKMKKNEKGREKRNETLGSKEMSRGEKSRRTAFTSLHSANWSRTIR